MKLVSRKWCCWFLCRARHVHVESRSSFLAWENTCRCGLCLRAEGSSTGDAKLETNMLMCALSTGGSCVAWIQFSALHCFGFLVLSTCPCSLRTIYNERRKLQDRPVSKHGLRSASASQVFFHYKTRRSESKSNWSISFSWKSTKVPWCLQQTSATKAIRLQPERIVNLEWPGWMLEKSSWRTETLLTCKSLVWAVLRNEILIELPSSWFIPKFPSG